MRGTTTAMALGLTAALTSQGSWTAEAQQPIDEIPIAGIWVLNEELSDETPKLSRDRGERSGGRRGGSRGGGAGFSGPGGFGVGGAGGGGGGGRGGSGHTDRPDPEEMAAMREAMQSAMEDLTTAARRMTIVFSDADEVLLTYEDGRVVRLIPDDREHAGLAGTSMEVTRRTKWQGDQLVTEIELQSRMKFELHQTYHADPDGRVLLVTSRFEGDRFDESGNQEFRRVYEREERASWN